MMYITELLVRRLLNRLLGKLVTSRGSLVGRRSHLQKRCGSLLFN